MNILQDMLLLTSIIFLAIPLPSNGQTIRLLGNQGVVNFPRSGECNGAYSDVIWEVNVNSGKEFVYISLNKFETSSGLLEFKTDKGEKSYSNGSILKDYSTDRDLIIAPISLPCNGLDISFSYTIVGVALQTMSREYYFEIRKTILFEIVIMNQGSRINIPCKVVYSPRNESQHKSANYIYAHPYDLPKTFVLTANCLLAVNTEDYLFPTSIKVESNLNKLACNLTKLEANYSTTTSHNITLTHVYQHSIKYLLISPNNGIFMTKDTGVFDEDQFNNSVTQYVVFPFNTTTLRSLGAGKHQLTLLLQNPVSMKTCYPEIILNELLQDLQVMTSSYVGISFVINITMEGAPAHVSVEIFASNSLVIFNDTLYCWSLCHSIQMKAQVPSTNAIYEVKVKAWNSISALNTSINIISSPQIYEGYITSSDPHVAVNVPTQIYLFLKRDVGRFNITLDIGGGENVIQFIVSQQGVKNYDPSINLPFYSREFTFIKQQYVFNAAKVYEITATIRSEKETFTISGNITVYQHRTSCLNNIRIRDGDRFSEYGEPLIVESEVVLTVDTVLSCVSSQRIYYQWTIYKVMSNVDVPEISLLTRNGPDLIVKTQDFSSGLYLVKVGVSLGDPASNSDVAMQHDYTQMLIKKTQPDVYIKGGNMLDIGVNSTLLLSSSVSIFDQVKQHWYCFASKYFIPKKVRNENIQKTGLCYNKWNEIEKDVEFDVSNLLPGKNYFIKLNTTASFNETTFIEKEILDVANVVPNLTLRCWLNCGKKFLPHLPMILQLECSGCVKYVWLLSYGNNTLNICDNHDLCKLSSKQLKLINNKHRAKATISVTGYDQAENRALITSFLRGNIAPVGGTCTSNLLYVIAYEQKFHISCTGFYQTFKSLSYKFSLNNFKDDHEALLQYGFDPFMKNIVVSYQSTFVQINVEICASYGACTKQAVPVNVRSYGDPFDIIAHNMDVAMSAMNIQKLTQLVIMSSTSSLLTPQKRNQVLSVIEKYPLTSLEILKQVADILKHLLNKPGTVDAGNLRLVENLLNKFEAGMTNFLNDESVNVDLVALTGQSCVSATAYLMASLPSAIMKVKEAARMIRIGKWMMRYLIPSENPITFHLWAVTGKLFRVHLNATDELTDTDGNVSFQPSNRGDIVNIEILQYNNQTINFSINDVVVDDVRALYTSSGWRNVSFDEEVQPSRTTLKFSKIYKNLSKLFLKIQSVCDASGCETIATTTASFLINDTNQDPGRRDVEFSLHNKDGCIKHLNLSVIMNNQSLVEKYFDSEASIYEWRVARSVLSSNTTLQLFIHASLDDRYIRKCSSLDTFLAIQWVQCVVWKYQVQTWKFIECQNVNSGLGLITCDCDHTAPLPLVGRGRSRATELPLLVATSHLPQPFAVSNEKVTNVWEQIKENPYSIISLVIIIIGFCLVCAMARKKDKESHQKQILIEPSDNSPYHNHRYSVTLYAGSCPNAGTTSKVAIKINGDHHSSQSHVLQDDVIHLTSGSVVSYLITTARSLAHINHVKLWIESSGRHPQWYLKRMAIRDIDGGKYCIFICNTWFNQVNLFQSFRSPQHLPNLKFKEIFPIKLENYLKNGHLWLSWLTMRPWKQETMNRVERISCCLLFTILLFMFSLLFHGRVVSWSPLRISQLNWSSVTSGLLSLLISSVITCIISTLLEVSRRTKQRPQESTSDLPTIKLQVGPQAGFVNSEFAFDSIDTGMFPLWVRNLVWIFLWIIVLICSVMTVVLSLEYGKETTKDGLISLLIGLTCSILIWEPLRAFLITCLVLCMIDDNEVVFAKDWICPVPNTVVPRTHDNPEEELRRQENERRTKLIYHRNRLESFLQPPVDETAL